MNLLDGVTMYDGIMALIVFFATVHGYWKGATWQIAPIMSLVLGYMIAMPMSVTSAHYFGDPPQNRLYALVTIYIGVSLVVYLLVRAFRAGIENAKLTEFDKHIGGLLGALKGVLITLATTVVLLIYSPIARDLILKSESSTIAAKIINAVYPILPQAMHQILLPYLKQLNNELPLDLQNLDADGTLNPRMLPDHSGNHPSDQPNMLSPTNSSARRLINEDDEATLPPAPPPRRKSTQYNDSNPQNNRQFDSATRSNRRYPTSDQEPPNPSRRAVLTPTVDDEDDPFRAGNPNR